MRKIVVFVISILLFSPLASAQLVDSLVSELLVNLEDKQWGRVIELYQDFAGSDPDNAEVLYWVKVADKDFDLIEPQMLQILGEAYRKDGRIEKAVVMFKAYFQKGSLKLNELLSLGQLSIDLGDVNFTQQVYEKVLELDPKNFSANNFLGNYLYLRAERERKRLDYEYKRIVKPTRMDYGKYRAQLKDLYLYSYKSAKKYLEQALQHTQSAETRSTLEHIQTIEDQVL